MCKALKRLFQSSKAPRSAAQRRSPGRHALRLGQLERRDVMSVSPIATVTKFMGNALHG
jgi:hypothetical protein